MSTKPGPSSSSASSTPTSVPLSHNGKSTSTASFVSAASDQVTDLRNLVSDRGDFGREYRYFHKRSLSAGESEAVGGNLKISCAQSAHISFEPHVQAIAFGRAWLKILPSGSSAVTSHQFPVFDLNWIFPPRIWVVYFPQVRVRGEKIGWKG